MPRKLKEAALTTRNARAKLAPREKPYYRAIDPDTQLGYRRGVRGGRWLVRWYRNGAYAQETLATADDALDADGGGILNYDQAVRKARSLVAERDAHAKAAKDGPALTVLDALTSYIAGRDAREDAHRGQSGPKRDARSRLTRHVQSKPIAAKLLYTLSEADLREWLRGAENELSPGTVRRLVNDLKAALNAMYAAHRNRLPAELPLVIRHGLKIEESPPTNARQQILPDADIRRLIAAAWDVDLNDEWDGDLAPVVVVLAATGGRFSQLSRMRVADVQPDAERLMVPHSRKGKGPKKVAQIAIRVGTDVIAVLQPLISGRRGTDYLFYRWRKKQTATSVWERDKRGPWHSSSEILRPWQLIVARAGFPPDTLPYCLRHSSIVRGLRAGLPVRLVAALHDTSAQMIERHYSAHIVDAMDELAARAVVPLTTMPATIHAIADRKLSNEQ